MSPFHAMPLFPFRQRQKAIHNRHISCNLKPPRHRTKMPRIFLRCSRCSPSPPPPPVRLHSLNSRTGFHTLQLDPTRISPLHLNFRPPTLTTRASLSAHRFLLPAAAEPFILFPGSHQSRSVRRPLQHRRGGWNGWRVYHPILWPFSFSFPFPLPLQRMDFSVQVHDPVCFFCGVAVCADGGSGSIAGAVRRGARRV